VSTQAELEQHIKKSLESNEPKRLYTLNLADFELSQPGNSLLRDSYSANNLSQTTLTLENNGSNMTGLQQIFRKKL
jgi:hypothetical protein